MTYYHYSGNRRAELHARKIERHSDFHVLRRLPKPSELWLTTSAGDDKAATIAVVDVETTGLDPKRHEAIELGVSLICLNEEGALTDATPPVTMLEEPTRPIPEAVEALTGISDAMVAGRGFDDDVLETLLDKADVIVSHHAAFDRAFLVRRFPGLTCRGPAR
ncbi:exonuclease domain-containing protein [Sphingomonas corticis]|jgi:DNA polymerase-3 subunit epsilon|uniref:Exonuclease domain-containing protein n=1 Tax=Sphingomonas corticis TaxID=2722791 RepID=A0ABX1CR20_9SPHN|nr:exonuclease domain-containing protein [Sphingomonas corticis]NJR80376.1 hypothetical protein [Sphingomonas corticis]